jgi:hypothetical protein
MVKAASEFATGQEGKAGQRRRCVRRGKHRWEGHAFWNPWRKALQAQPSWASPPSCATPSVSKPDLRIRALLIETVITTITIITNQTMKLLLQAHLLHSTGDKTVHPYITTIRFRVRHTTITTMLPYEAIRQSSNPW